MKLRKQVSKYCDFKPVTFKISRNEYLTLVKKNYSDSLKHLFSWIDWYNFTNIVINTSKLNYGLSYLILMLLY